MTFEMNFDGLIGPTHSYGGLSYGNIASMQHGKHVSNPKKAALQGLEKMKTLMTLGIKQGVLPPHERPYLPFLHAVGFRGSLREVLEAAWREDPSLVIASASAAAMWTANAATVSPSADTADKKVHFTPANLISKLHRTFEAETTRRVLSCIFDDPAHFVHHAPLLSQDDFADEGAANHTRLCSSFGERGIELFVYGRTTKGEGNAPGLFPARQTDRACFSIARRHALSEDATCVVQQNPLAIDAGVFHNDVISVGHRDLFFYHEQAFVETNSAIEALQEKMERVCHTPLVTVCVKEKEIPLKEAVKTYLFNSQIVTTSDGSTVLIAPAECRASPVVSDYLTHMTPIQRIIYQDIRESMQNGGGPACLRLRIVLTDAEYKAMHKGVELTEELYRKLDAWVETHYRDRLTPDDLRDPQLAMEGQQALDALTGILQLGSIYSFQRGENHV